MKNTIYISLILLIGFSIASCKKDNPEEEKTKEQPVFTFVYPTENQVYEFGDTVQIKGTIVAAYDMHGYNVKISNTKTNTLVLNQGYHEHGSSFTFNESWKNTVADTSQMKITVDVAIDHDGNLATKEIIVTCLPQP